MKTVLLGSTVLGMAWALAGMRWPSRFDCRDGRKPAEMLRQLLLLHHPLDVGIGAIRGQSRGDGIAGAIAPEPTVIAVEGGFEHAATFRHAAALFGGNALVAAALSPFL